MFMPSDAIEVKVAGSVATILLNRPDRSNALTRAMIAGLRESLRDLYLEKKVRAIVLTGAGDAFCGGRDIHEMIAPTQEARPHAIADAAAADANADDLDTISIESEADKHRRWGDEAAEYRDLIVDMLELPKPIIASVNGAAAACGAGLVLASDIVIAGPGARFGVPDARRGMVAGVVAPLLAYRLGAGQAAKLLMTSELIDAAEAQRVGVYHEIVPNDFLWARAAEVGEGCGGAAPEAVGLTKRLLLETAGEQLATQLTSGAIATATSRTTASASEGLKAFVEKRAPDWGRKTT